VLGITIKEEFDLTSDLINYVQVKLLIKKKMFKLIKLNVFFDNYFGR
jgi:hypothetical protein